MKHTKEYSDLLTLIKFSEKEIKEWQKFLATLKKELDSLRR